MTNQSTRSQKTDFDGKKCLGSRPDIRLVSSRPQNRVLIQADCATYVKKITLTREPVSTGEHSQFPNVAVEGLSSDPMSESNQLLIDCQLNLPHSKSMPLSGADDKFDKCLYHVTVSESSYNVSGGGSQPPRDDAHMLLSTLDSQSNPEMTDHLDRIAWQLDQLTKQTWSKMTGKTPDYLSYEDMNTTAVPYAQSEEQMRPSRIDCTGDKTPLIVRSAGKMKVRSSSRSCPRQLIALFRRLSPCRCRSSSQKTERQVEAVPEEVVKGFSRQSQSLTRSPTYTSKKDETKSVDIQYFPEDPVILISSEATKQFTAKPTDILKQDVPKRSRDMVEGNRSTSTLPVSHSFELDATPLRSRTLPLQTRMLQLHLANQEHKSPIYLNAALCAYGYGRKPDWKQFSVSPSLRRLLRSRQSERETNGENINTVLASKFGEPINGRVERQSHVGSPRVTDEQAPPADQQGNEIQNWHIDSGKSHSESKFNKSNDSDSEITEDIFYPRTDDENEIITDDTFTDRSEVTYNSKTSERAGSSPTKLRCSSDFSTVVDAIRSTTPPIKRRNSAAAVKAKAAKISQAKRNAFNGVSSRKPLPDKALTYEQPSSFGKSAPNSNLLSSDPDTNTDIFQPEQLYLQGHSGSTVSPSWHSSKVMHLQSIPELSPTNSSLENEPISPLSQELSKAHSLEQITDRHFYK